MQQVIGHLKDEFYRGCDSTRTSGSNANWTRASCIGTPDGVRYDCEGHAPEEFRSMSLAV